MRGYPPEQQQQEQGGRPPYPTPSQRDGQLQRGGGGGGTTTLVIGGATPIHLPKSPVVSSKASAVKKARTAASVFRGRPEAEESSKPSASVSSAAVAAAADDDDADDRPQNILLSQRTPSHSFEDKTKKKQSPSDSLSPGDVVQRSPEQLFEVCSFLQVEKCFRAAFSF